MSIYTEQGYKSRRDYLEQMAQEFDVPFEAVLAASDILGPDEDFDGLIATLEDYETLFGGE